MQTQEQKQDATPQITSKKLPWWRITLLALTAFLIIIPGILLVENSGDSSATFLNSIFVVIGVLGTIGQLLIPIIFPPKSQPSTIIQHIYQPAGAQQPQQTPQSTPVSPPPSVIPPSSNSAAPPLENKAPIPPSNITLPTRPVFYFNVAHLPNIDELYGRKRERMTLLERTRKGDSTSIVGPRRIGKTWLLDYLKLVAPTELGANFRIANLDGTTPQRKTMSAFVAQTLDALDIPLIGNPAELELNMLTKTIERLQSQHIQSVLCIDEFEGFFNRQDFDCDFFAGLRYLATNGLLLVTVSKSPLIDLVGERCQTSGFFNIFEQITLKPFNNTEAEEFVQAKSIQAGFNADERSTLLKYGQMNKMEWPPLRLQLTGEKLLADKKLAAQGHSEYYRPGKQDYWQDFERRLEETYRGAVR